MFGYTYEKLELATHIMNYVREKNDVDSNEIVEIINDSKLDSEGKKEIINFLKGE